MKVDWVLAMGLKYLTEIAAKAQRPTSFPTYLLWRQLICLFFVEGFEMIDFPPWIRIKGYLYIESNTKILLLLFFGNFDQQSLQNSRFLLTFWFKKEISDDKNVWKIVLGCCSTKSAQKAEEKCFSTVKCVFLKQLKDALRWREIFTAEDNSKKTSRILVHPSNTRGSRSSPGESFFCFCSMFSKHHYLMEI